MICQLADLQLSRHQRVELIPEQFEFEMATFTGQGCLILQLKCSGIA
jgi:hypothetical protein